MSPASSSSAREAGEAICLSFGDPEPVISRVSDYLGTFLNDAGLWFEPPVPFNGLSKMTRANAHHGTCIIFRRNMLVNEFLPSEGISRADFRAAQTDFLTFGNAFLQVIWNRFGKVVALRHLPAINMRRGRGDRFFTLTQSGQTIEFKPGEVLHLKEYDTQQGIYGIPDWLGGLQSVLLNEDATLFRRKYFKNGAHLGYILYTNDAQIGPETEASIKNNLQQGKGAGNFRSMYLHIPNGKEKSVQVLPIGDIGQKDEFERIKNISADDVITAHRVPPALVAIKPSAATSFGDVEKVEGVYRRTELEAMKNPWLELNEVLPPKLQIKFKEPPPPMSARITSAGLALLAAKAAAGQTLTIDKMVFAYISGLDTNATPPLSEGMPAGGDIKLQASITAAGVTGSNTVVYSSVLGPDVGDWSFNWLGLYSTANATLVAVSYVPSQTKRATTGVQMGNSLTKNFAIEYTDIGTLTGVTINASTWQLDFTSLLAGKANTIHGHAISDVPGLADALGGKAPTNHSHEALVPPGAVMPFAMATPPAGWLKANSAVISRTTYAGLFAAIGTLYGPGDGVSTFQLPDLRGEFVRGWADDRSVDTGRTLGSAQADEIKSHNHQILFDKGENDAGGSGSDLRYGGVPEVSVYTATTGGAETRPRNIALNYCIKT